MQLSVSLENIFTKGNVIYIYKCWQRWESNLTGFFSKIERNYHPKQYAPDDVDEQPIGLPWDQLLSYVQSS